MLAQHAVNVTSTSNKSFSESMAPAKGDKVLTEILWCKVTHIHLDRAASVFYTKPTEYAS
jgi:hypothetical protein